MYLVDTCGWIEWLTNGKDAQHFGSYLKKIERLIIPTIIQFELYKWLCREKDETIALEIISLTESGSVVVLDTALAFHAVDVSKKYKLAMADAIIYATSQLHSAKLITSDNHFASLPNIEFIAKN